MERGGNLTNNNQVLHFCKQVMNKSDPVGWDTRNEIMLIRHFCKDFKEWSFKWVPRSTNVGADAVAKWSRVTSVTLRFLKFLLPFCLPLH